MELLLLTGLLKVPLSMEPLLVTVELKSAPEMVAPLLFVTDASVLKVPPEMELLLVTGLLKVPPVMEPLFVTGQLNSAPEIVPMESFVTDAEEVKVPAVMEPILLTVQLKVPPEIVFLAYTMLQVKFPPVTDPLTAIDILPDEIVPPTTVAPDPTLMISDFV